MFQTSPRLPLQSVNMKLPSDEKLWEAATPAKWLEFLKDGKYIYPDFPSEEKSRLSVRDVIQGLWTEGRNLRPTTQLGSIALISMLVSRPLDTILYRCDANIQRPNQDLAAIPEFARWRNTVCDCLDILHWEALSLSAKAGSVEGPLFLHLHLARLTLLTPVRQFFDYIHVTGRNQTTFSSPHNMYTVPESRLQCEEMIRTWVCDDRFKARLSLIHAGAILWHVRRYSSDSFVEPFAVCLAIITLWMYGKHFNYQMTWLHRSTSPPSSIEDEEHSSAISNIREESITNSGDTSRSRHDVVLSSSSTGRPDHHILPRYQRMPKSLQLDRPIDDELVLEFHSLRHKNDTLTRRSIRFVYQPGP